MVSLKGAEKAVVILSHSVLFLNLFLLLEFNHISAVIMYFFST